MRYIAFENTYNEQIYDSETKTVTFKTGQTIEDVKPIFKRGRWTPLKESK